MEKQAVSIDMITFQKMNFIMNAIETGWTVKKNDDNYIFSKKHEGKREVFMSDYLEKFIDKNMKLDEKTLGNSQLNR
jgi:hypothetical protein